MGYPMTYPRLLERNSLLGNYTRARDYWNSDIEPGSYYGNNLGMSVLRMISGDLRRLEQDALQPGTYRTQLAKNAQVDEDTLVRVLTAFFEDYGTPLPNLPPHDE